MKYKIDIVIARERSECGNLLPKTKNKNNAQKIER